MVFILCFLTVVGADSAAWNFFRLVNSKVLDHGNDIKLVTKELFTPYSQLCLQVDFCDDALEFIRESYLHELRWRAMFLSRIELVLQRLRRRRES